MTDLSAELAFALDVARLGGRIAMGHYRRDPRRELKRDGTWVTEADWAVEAQIRLRIARSWPDHNILGEEEGLTAAGGGPSVEGAPTWVVDPIDGTNNYMAGIPIWATLVGLQIDGRNAVGVAHAPALGETYDGAIGLGARCNDAQIATDEIDSLANATVLYADIPDHDDVAYARTFRTLVRTASRTRGLGDFWGHMLVARGAAHVMIEPVLSAWDVAALEPIVTEAGGRVARVGGDPFEPGGSCVTSCSALAPLIDGIAAAP